MDTAFRDYVEKLKAKIQIEDIIAEDEPLHDTGRRYWRGVRHDSLKVDIVNQLFKWYSRPEIPGGDVFTWLTQYRRLDFGDAVQLLADRTGVRPPDWTPEAQRAHLAARAQASLLDVATTHYELTLARHPAARSYCCEWRGWQWETVQAARLGFWDGDARALRAAWAKAGCDALTPLAQAIAGMPPGMLIFPHVFRGHIVTLSARLAATLRAEPDRYAVWRALTAAEQYFPFTPETQAAVAKAASDAAKRHHNLPGDAAGEAQPYWNYVATPGRGSIVVVEGQSDAVTLAQWDLPAVALGRCTSAKTQAHAELVAILRDHRPVYIALDADMAGKSGMAELAQLLGPLVKLVTWEAANG